MAILQLLQDINKPAPTAEERIPINDDPYEAHRLVENYLYGSNRRFHELFRLSKRQFRILVRWLREFSLEDTQYIVLK